MNFDEDRIWGGLDYAEEDRFVLQSFNQKDLNQEDKNRLIIETMDNLFILTKKTPCSCELRVESFWHDGTVYWDGKRDCFASVEFSLYKDNKKLGEGGSLFYGNWCYPRCLILENTIDIERTDLVMDCFR